MEFKFIPTNIGCYQIIEASDGRRYLMDTSTVSPKKYYWGFRTDTLTIDVVELHHTNLQFSLTGKVDPNTAIIAVAVQPLVKVMDSVMQDIFQTTGLSQQLFWKGLLFGVSMFISYLIIKYSLKRAHRKGNERLPQNAKWKKLIFKTNNKRNYTMYTFVLLHFICLVFYLTINNGIEGVFLIINSLLSLVTFMGVVSMAPIEVTYRGREIVFEKIEEI